MKKYRLIMFDLDGTIADTSEGVIHCVKYAQEKLQLRQLSEDTYKKFIGPPNRDSYSRYYGLTGELLDRAIQAHKAYAVKHGVYEAAIYPGIRELLSALKADGVTLAVVTLKLQESAEKMLKYFRLDGYFDVIMAVAGTESKKSNLIDLCLKKVDILKENAVMVGDSEYDQIGAMESEVDFLGVTYGFGFQSKSDTEDLPCIAVAENVKEIYQLLRER